MGQAAVGHTYCSQHGPFGRKPSKAKYYLDDTVDVVKLLYGLANASDDTVDVVKLLSGLANASDPKSSNTPARFQVTFDALF
ncbi:hypothetical protein Tco_0891947 [Tanacetum coccineum]|uniref:Uncharacterized protein n=1 Tax=Tanacetum coccineum TaxID=301880 RepID=A0ABQ5C4N2_9ASTR